MTHLLSNPQLSAYTQITLYLNTILTQFSLYPPNLQNHIYFQIPPLTKIPVPHYISIIPSYFLPISLPINPPPPMPKFFSPIFVFPPKLLSNSSNFHPYPTNPRTNIHPKPVPDFLLTSLRQHKPYQQSSTTSLSIILKKISVNIVTKDSKMRGLSKSGSKASIYKRPLSSAAEARNLMRNSIHLKGKVEVWRADIVID